MAGKTATLAIKILGDAKDAQRALDDTASSASKLQDGVGKAAVPAAAALAGLAAAGISAAKAAAEDQASQAQLALALKNATGASKSQVAQTEDWISKTSKASAVADDELRPALATLARSTGDVEESQKAMGVALDVSAATGKDVESVSDALAKAYAGNTTSLGKLVPGIDKAVLASGDMDAIMAELARTTGGAAATAAGTAAGQMEGMKIQMAEAQEAIGGALLPAMSALAGILSTVATWVQENTTLFLVIGGVIGVVAAAILILNVAFKAYAVITKAVAAATKVWTAIQWLWNAAMSANPLTIIIIAIIALVAAIVLIATKTTWFQDIWAAVWGFVTGIAEAAWAAIVSAATTALDWLVGIWESLKGAVSAVWDWIQNAVQVVLAVIVALVRAYINIYVTIWETIKAAVQAVWDWISRIIDSVLGGIKRIVQSEINGIILIWEGIKAAVGAVWDWLEDTASRVLDGILAPVNAIKAAFDRVVDSIKSVIDWIKNIKIPAAVQGAIDAIGGILPSSASASSGTVAAVGVGVGALTRGAPTLSSSSSGGGVTIVVQGALDPVAVARQIRTILGADERRRAGVVIA
jgi:phage-related protein